jgi:hypothetical protein
MPITWSMGYGFSLTYGYGLQFPANQLGGWILLWGTRSYAFMGCKGYGL